MIKQQQLTKRAENFDTERKEESEFEQKPLLKFNEFNDEEEKEIKQQQREKNRKHKHVSDEERLAKLQKKTANNKEKEKQMWEKLKNLRILKSTKVLKIKRCQQPSFSSWIWPAGGFSKQIFLLAKHVAAQIVS